MKKWIVNALALGLVVAGVPSYASWHNDYKVSLDESANAVWEAKPHGGSFVGLSAGDSLTIDETLLCGVEVFKASIAGSGEVDIEELTYTITDGSDTWVITAELDEDELEWEVTLNSNEQTLQGCDTKTDCQGSGIPAEFYGEVSSGLTVTTVSGSEVEAEYVIVRGEEC